MRKLLNIDANPKTIKGQARGYMTAVLYLSPYTLSGRNLCPTAELAGCWRTCLNVAGHGGIPTGQWLNENVPDNAVQRARLARTRLYTENPAEFFAQLTAELAAFVRKAKRAGLTPCVRLNGTSDIVWERIELPGAMGATIFSRFPDVQFYDYTKLPKRLAHALPANYHLSVSWSGRNGRYRLTAEHYAREHGAPLVIVDADGYRKDGTIAEPVWHRLWQVAASAGCKRIVNGDDTDLRFLDPAHSLVVLRAKGSARKETNGFVFGRKGQ